MRTALKRKARQCSYQFVPAGAVPSEQPVREAVTIGSHHHDGVKDKGETVTYRYVSRYYVTGGLDGPDCSSHL